MPNFDAQVRTDYRDVAGMALSLVRADIVEDVSNPGFILKWINRAPGVPSIPFIRQPGDPAPTYAGGRFGDPINRDTATQPTLALTGGGEQRAQFDRARSTFLETEFIAGPMPAVAQPLACGFQWQAGADATTPQILFTTSAANILSCVRQTGGGNAVMACGTVFTNVAGDLPSGTYLFTGEAGGTGLWLQDGGAFGAGSANATVINAAVSMLLGRDTGGNYLDGTMDGLHVWLQELSPLSLDFIWQTLNADGIDYSANLRGPMNKPIWTDVTGDLSLSEINRLNPLTGVPFRYVLVTLPPAPALHRVQVAAAVNGQVLPDAQLGGDLFTHAWIEVPGPPVIFPVTNQDAGWSSVMDFSLNQEGHYTLGITRQNGGAVIVHFDVQVTP